jgi:hypothetical protein
MTGSRDQRKSAAAQNRSCTPNGLQDLFWWGAVPCRDEARNRSLAQEPKGGGDSQAYGSTSSAYRSFMVARTLSPSVSQIS